MSAPSAGSRPFRSLPRISTARAQNRTGSARLPRRAPRRHECRSARYHAPGDEARRAEGRHRRPHGVGLDVDARHEAGPRQNEQQVRVLQSGEALGVLDVRVRRRVAQAAGCVDLRRGVCFYQWTSTSARLRTRDGQSGPLYEPGGVSPPPKGTLSTRVEAVAQGKFHSGGARRTATRLRRRTGPRRAPGAWPGPPWASRGPWA